MIEQDTVKLLRECDAGVKMGVSSIGDVLGRVRSPKLETLLTDCKREHEALGGEIRRALERFHDEGRDPGAVATVMTELKTGLKLAADGTDAAVAELMTDGCNMGVKSLSRYLNQYKAADESAKDVAKRLIALEAGLSESMRDYL